MIKLFVQEDISGARTIELDRFTNEGNAVLFVTYSAGSKEYVISLDTLKVLLEQGSFTYSLGGSRAKP